MCGSIFEIMMVFETYWQTQIFFLYFQIQNQQCQITNTDSDKGKINTPASPYCTKAATHEQIISRPLYCNIHLAESRLEATSSVQSEKLAR